MRTDFQNWQCIHVSPQPNGTIAITATLAAIGAAGLAIIAIAMWFGGVFAPEPEGEAVIEQLGAPAPAPAPSASPATPAASDPKPAEDDVIDDLVRAYEEKPAAPAQPLPDAPAGADDSIISSLLDPGSDTGNDGEPDGQKKEPGA